MMKSITRKTLSTLVAAAATVLAIAGQAQAATSWSVSYSGCTSGANYGTNGAWDEITCATNTGTAGVDTAVAALAWSGNPATAVGATVVSWGSNGLGVYSSGDTNTNGPHAIDNYTMMDSIVMRFNQAVNLNTLTIGWNGTDNPVAATSTQPAYDDSDVGIFAWTGATPVAGASATSLTQSGWTLVKSIADMGSLPNNTATGFNPNNITSSYWLVAAYSVDCYYDAFKLLSVAGTVGTPTTPSVPEPGSLALLALTGAGLFWTRRQRQHQALV